MTTGVTTRTRPGSGLATRMRGTTSRKSLHAPVWTNGEKRRDDSRTRKRKQEPRTNLGPSGDDGQIGESTAAARIGVTIALEVQDGRHGKQEPSHPARRSWRVAPHGTQRAHHAGASWPNETERAHQKRSASAP